MSHWCGKCDFRDTLSIHFKDDFKDFVKRTGGIIHQRDGKDFKDIIITQPADLIPYYTHLISCATFSPDNTSIRITQNSYLDTRIKEIEEFNEKYPDWKHSTVYYEIQKNRLAALYEREKIKPIEEQGIVDN
jgi:hypothetical protein